MKKIIAFLLIMAVLINCLPVLGLAASEANSYSISFLNDLSITEKGSDSAEEVISRAEFVDFVVRAMNAQTAQNTNSCFSDVESTDAYASSINYAYNMKMIAGSGDGMFYPYNAVTYAAAIKICIGALGYTSIAQAKGGYPAGYLSVAHDINLTAGINSNLNDALSFGQCADIICNFLYTDLCMPVAVQDGNSVMERRYGENWLTNGFKLTKVSGIIKIAGFSSMVSDADIFESTIMVNGKYYGCGVDAPESNLGLYADCWHDESGNVRAIYKSSQNATVTIACDGVVSANSERITVYDENSLKEKSYRLDNITFVKNGRSAIPDVTDYMKDGATLTLIDNDGNNVYDAVISWQYKYMIVSGVNLQKSQVYPKGTGSDVLTLKNDDGYSCIIKQKTDDGIYVDSSIGDITEGMVIKYALSDDGMYTVALVCADSISATVEEMSNNKVYIDGSVYKLNSYFIDNYTVTPGQTAKFLLACDGTITGFGGAAYDEMVYGYLVKAKLRNEGLGNSFPVAILTSDGEIITTELADNIVLDGIARKITAQEVVSALCYEKAPRYQLLKYKLNSDGKVCKIDTAVMVTTLDPYEAYGTSLYGDDSLRCFMKAETTFWHSSTELLAPHAYIGGGVTIFRVPTEVTETTDEVYDDQYFSVIDTSKLDSSYETYRMDLYDLDRNTVPGAVVLYRRATSGSSSSSVSKKNASAIIDKVSYALTEDGTPAHTVTYWSQGVYYRAPINDAAYQLLVQSGAVPAVGDIVRLSTNRSGEIEAMEIDVRYDASTKSITAVTTTLTGGQVGYALSTGKVFSHSMDTITIMPTYYNHSADHGRDLIAGVLTYSFNSKLSVARFDTKSGMVKPADISELADAVSVGGSNASTVALISYSNGVNHLFIYD